MQAAVDALPRHGVRVLASSSTYDTDPVGLVLDQPAFLNACVRIATDLGPEALLDACKAVERERGRTQPGEGGYVVKGPRPIDVDLLLLGDTAFRSARLTLPHEQVTARRFVLIPLLELDFDLVTPDGERLSDRDILGFCFVVVAGGSDTTASLISHGVALLSERPDQRAVLIDDPAVIGGAIIEFLRLESSVQGLCRTTIQDVTIHDTTIPAGEKVMMLYGSDNRDQREFGDDADRLDVRRAIPRHLAFSSGPHFCIGSHLARLQARVAFEELLALHPERRARAQNLRSP